MRMLPAISTTLTSPPHKSLWRFEPCPLFLRQTVTPPRQTVKGLRQTVKGLRHPVKGLRHPMKGLRHPVKGLEHPRTGFYQRDAH